MPAGGINQNLYYRWSKEFLEADKKRLAGDTAREATSDEVAGLRREAVALKEVVAELTLENRLLNGYHGLNIAVLVNDFGMVNIDSELVIGVEGDVISLTNVACVARCAMTSSTR